MSFTRGPWTLRADPCHFDSMSSVYAGDINVAEISGKNGAEQDANARLIAAAPDLLAALQAFVDANDNGPANEWVQRMIASDKKAREAIAKATQP